MFILNANRYLNRDMSEKASFTNEMAEFRTKRGLV